MRKILLILLFIPLLVAGQSDKVMIKKGVDVKEHVPKGIEIGSNAPVFIAKSISGVEINLDEIFKNEKEAVIIFYRGNWCPYCNRHLSNLNDSLKYIEEAGGKVLVVGPENFDNAEKTANKSEATFTLIPDTTMKIMQDFDVLFKVTKKYNGKIKTFLFTDIAKNNNQEEAKLPVPATYVIDRNGKIKWRHFDYDYTKRASAKAIINALKE